jgi:hypothetical protein
MTITPEQIIMGVKGYVPGHWDYAARCADLPAALEVIRQRIDEWDRHVDPHGWWHERPCLIALYNAAVANVAKTKTQHDDNAP